MRFPFITACLFVFVCCASLPALNAYWEIQEVPPFDSFQGNIGPVEILNIHKDQVIQKDFEEANLIAANIAPESIYPIQKALHLPQEEKKKSISSKSFSPPNSITKEAEPKEQKSIAVSKETKPKKLGDVQKTLGDVFKPVDQEILVPDNGVESDTEEALPFLTSDFFADSLGGILESEDSSMGTQRLLDMKPNLIEPTVTVASSFKYSANPLKAENTETEDITSLDLSINLNLKLGDFPIGENVLSSPSVTFMQIRTLNDPFKDQGKVLSFMNSDVTIAGLSVPFMLPHDFALTLAHSYVAPFSVEGDNQQISYSNSPSLSFSKSFNLGIGHILSFSTGYSYTFSKSDTLEAQLDPDYFNFLQELMGGSSVVQSRFPSNLQNGYAHSIGLNYLIPLTEELQFSPSFSYQNTMFTEGDNQGRSDKSYNAGINASLSLSEMFTFSVMSNYNWKKSNNPDTPEFKDFISGVTLSGSYSF